jgi:hypothetical protein
LYVRWFQGEQLPDVALPEERQYLKKPELAMAYKIVVYLGAGKIQIWHKPMSISGR